jgi:beta-N-acetylhexosaminidase
MGVPAAAIFGCTGPRLSDEERAFFRDVDPLGFILFARNVRTPSQVHALTGDLRDCVGRADAPVLSIGWPRRTSGCHQQ